MSGISLEITYHHGQAVAAYLCLPRREDDRVERSRRVGNMVADLTRDGRLVGVEFVSARGVDVGELDRLLADHGVCPVDRQELTPLLGA